MTTEIKSGNFSKGPIKKENLLDCCIDHLNGADAKKDKDLRITHLVHRILETLKVGEGDVHLRITATSLTYNADTINEGEAGWDSIANDLYEILERVGKTWDKCSPTHPGEPKATGAKGSGKGAAPGKHIGGGGSGSGDTYNCDHCTHYHGGEPLTHSRSGSPVSAASFDGTYAAGSKYAHSASHGKSHAVADSDEEDDRDEQIRELNENLTKAKAQAKVAKQQLEEFVASLGALQDDEEEE